MVKYVNGICIQLHSSELGPKQSAPCSVRRQPVCALSQTTFSSTTICDNQMVRFSPSPDEIAKSVFCWVYCFPVCYVTWVLFTMRWDWTVQMKNIDFNIDFKYKVFENAFYPTQRARCRESVPICYTAVQHHQIYRTSKSNTFRKHFPGTFRQWSLRKWTQFP